MVLLLLGFLAINVIGLRTRLNLLQKRVSQVYLLNLMIKLILTMNNLNAVAITMLNAYCNIFHLHSNVCICSFVLFFIFILPYGVSFASEKQK